LESEFGQIPEWQLHFWKWDRTKVVIVEKRKKCIINYQQRKRC